jgi:hypothetical protein
MTYLADCSHVTRLATINRERRLPAFAGMASMAQGAT